MARDILNVSSILLKRDMLDLRTDAAKQIDACAMALSGMRSHQKAIRTISQTLVLENQAVIVSALREAVANINVIGRAHRRRKIE